MGLSRPNYARTSEATKRSNSTVRMTQPLSAGEAVELLLPNLRFDAIRPVNPPETRNPKPQTPNPKHQTPNTKHQTPNTKPQTPNPEPQTPNPEAQPAGGGQLRDPHLKLIGQLTVHRWDHVGGSCVIHIFGVFFGIG